MTKCITVILALASISAVGLAAAPATQPAFYAWAATPPMGWNSWDCFGTGVTEEQTLANADYMQKNLLSHGWNIITIDIQWYEPKANTLNYRQNAVLEMDNYGRLLPAGNRFPSTAAAHSFKPIADALHQRGLKFGLHLLRGIPRQAVERNMPILNTPYHAADIADKNDTCQWNPDMYGVDMSKPGAQEYYNSVFQLFATWDLDFVKVDDLSRPYHKAEIEGIRKAIDLCGRPIVFSTSPGATPVSEGPHVSTHANMWRISDDFWDSWKSLKEQFARLDAWTPYRGEGHWPDADMLPLGNVRAFTKNGWTHFTHDEQRTMLTLWSIARSPLIVGANLPANDDFTLSLLSNDEILAVDQHSINNRQLSRKDDLIVWTADVPNSPDRYVALFNAQENKKGATPQVATVTVNLSDMNLSSPVAVRDLWTHQNLPNTDTAITATLLPHTAALYRLSPTK
ncbi:MAG TPA: glycoside hydrolase family 27 protein [Phycisphaerae bacterium]|nr:glycoside hydrolase family 27 protein [Phycisphaerae bacterium]